MGERLALTPDRYREDVEALLRQLAALTQHGCFPMTKDSVRGGDWAWGDYDRLVPHTRHRKDQLAAKADQYPNDRPRPLSLLEDGP
jgi:hypothetical protein